MSVSDRHRSMAKRILRPCADAVISQITKPLFSSSISPPPPSPPPLPTPFFSRPSADAGVSVAGSEVNPLLIGNQHPSDHPLIPNPLYNPSTSLFSMPHKPLHGTITVANPQQHQPSFPKPHCSPANCFLKSPHPACLPPEGDVPPRPPFLKTIWPPHPVATICSLQNVVQRYRIIHLGSCECMPFRLRTSSMMFTAKERNRHRVYRSGSETMGNRRYYEYRGRWRGQLR